MPTIILTTPSGVILTTPSGIILVVSLSAVQPYQHEPLLPNLHAVVAGRAMYVQIGTLSEKLSETPEFTFTVRAQDLDPIDPYLQDAALVWNGAVVISGFVYDDPEIIIDRDGAVLKQLHCYGEIGRLTCKRKKTDAHYQDAALVFILTDLLNTDTTDWELGDTSTMIDVLVATTIDLRNKQTKFAQVAEAVKSVPGLFMRYGGFNVGTGRHRLDVGFFGELEVPGVTQHDNLIELRKNKSTRRVYRVIEATGGKGNDQVITLLNALNFDPALAVHPDYPVTLSGLDYIVTNNNAALGCEISKEFQVHKTSNDSVATQAELDEAGFALWQKCVRFFEQNQAHLSLTATAVLNRVPPIGDQVQVIGNVIERAWDETQQVEEEIETLRVDEPLRITAYDVDFVDDQGYDSLAEQARIRVEVQMELSDSDYPEEFDDSLLLFEEVERFDNKDQVTALFPADIIIGTDTEGPGVVSNCVQAITGFNGRIFDVPLPAVPPGATAVNFTTQTTPVGAIVETIQNPAIPATDWQGCVSINGGWVIGDAVTVEVVFIFT
jgi:hypothetical protein